MNIRTAMVDDSNAIRAVYASYIDTPVTFETVLPTETEFKERVAGILAEYPYLVGIENGTICGYAYAHRHRERTAYQWNAELSVYLDKRFTSRGAGRRLYGALIDLLRLQGIRTVYGSVTLPNEPSVRLHLGMGFTLLGTYHQTGYKSGGWHDVACFEKDILPHGLHPAPVIPFCQIPRASVEAVLDRWQPDVRD